MWITFALQKLLTFLQQNISVFENTLATIVNEFVINEVLKLTMLWTTRPWILHIPSQKEEKENDTKATS